MVKCLKFRKIIDRIVIIIMETISIDERKLVNFEILSQEFLFDIYPIQMKCYETRMIMKHRLMVAR